MVKSGYKTAPALTHKIEPAFEQRGQSLTSLADSHSLRGWSDFTGWASSQYDTFRSEILPTMTEWLLATAKTSLKNLAIGAVTSLLLDSQTVQLPAMLEDDLDFYSWIERKILNSMHPSEYVPDATVLYEQLLDVIEDLQDVLDTYNSYRNECVALYSSWRIDVSRRGIGKYIDQQGNVVMPTQEFAKVKAKYFPSSPPSEPDTFEQNKVSLSMAKLSTSSKGPRAPSRRAQFIASEDRK